MTWQRYKLNLRNSLLLEEYFLTVRLNGLKAQKLLAQGIALGITAINKTPCKGKSFVYCLVL